MTKKSKQCEGLKACKHARRQRHQNAAAFAAIRVINEKGRDEIIKEIMEHYGYAYDTAENIYVEATKNVERRYVADFVRLSNKNLKRLDAMTEDALDEDDKQTALKAIDTLNKMVGAYTTKVDVTSNGDTPQFKIKIDQ